MDANLADTTVVHPPPLPCSYLFVGCSGSGKSTLTKDMLLNWEEIFGEKPRRVIIIYNYYQPMYSEIQAKYPDRCLFATNLTEDIVSEKTLGSASAGQAVLLIDDIAHTLTKSELLASIFIGHSHHLGIVAVSAYWNKCTVSIVLNT